MSLVLALDRRPHGPLAQLNKIFQHEFVNIFLSFVLPAQKNRFIEYPQHMFWLRNKKINYALLFGGLDNHIPYMYMPAHEILMLIA